MEYPPERRREWRERRERRGNRMKGERETVYTKKNIVTTQSYTVYRNLCGLIVELAALVLACSDSSRP